MLACLAHSLAEGGVLAGAGGGSSRGWYCCKLQRMLESTHSLPDRQVSNSPVKMRQGGRGCWRRRLSTAISSQLKIRSLRSGIESADMSFGLTNSVASSLAVQAKAMQAAGAALQSDFAGSCGVLVDVGARILKF